MKVRIAAGFDGADRDDWSAIRAETIDDAFQFTPTYDLGGDKRPTIWDPAEFGGRTPRAHVHAAWDQLVQEYDVVRAYYDPPLWSTEGEEWQRLYGDHVFVPWETGRLTPMHASLERFVVDLSQGAFKHDGCPITATHIANARRAPKPGLKYLLEKPHGAYHQKIDAAMASVLAHEAAADVRATPEPVKKGLTRVRGRTAGY